MSTAVETPPETMAPAGPRGERAPAVMAWAFLVFSAVALLPYVWSLIAQLHERTPGFDPVMVTALVLFVTLAVVAIVCPVWGAYIVLFSLPFFGNHPGGRLMEAVNIPLAANVIGLVWAARRRDARPPSGLVWWAATAYVLSAVVALVPALPGVLIRLAQVDDLRTAVLSAVTAPEADPLYSLQSGVGVALAVAWAYAVCWRMPGKEFVRNAFRSVGLAVVLVTGIGALKFHGILDPDSLLRLIDDTWHLVYEAPNQMATFRSVFWNQGWFAMYFTTAFSLAFGLVWLERSAARIAWAAAFGTAYLYFLANPQRGGFLSLHAALLLLVMVQAGVPRAKRMKRVIAISLVVTAVLLTGLLAGRTLPGWHARGAHRAVVSVSDDIRDRLIVAGLTMWKAAPVFGIGEGAFAWRFREFVPVASRGDSPAQGDAHNTWLQIAATRGLLGFTTFLLVMAVGLATAIRAFRSKATEASGAGLAILMGFCAFTAYSFFQGMFYLQCLQILFWALVALACLAEDAPPRHLAVSRWTFLIAVAVAAIAVDGALNAGQLRASVARITREPKGFYGIDERGGRAFRWSSARGTLCIYPTRAVVSVPILVGDPQAARAPATVELSIQHRTVDRFEVASPGVLERRFYLTEAYASSRQRAHMKFGECASEQRPLELGVKVDRTWVPATRLVSLDTRRLGVAVGEPTFSEPKPGELYGTYGDETGPDGPFMWTGPRGSAVVSVPRGAERLMLRLRALGRRLPVRVVVYWNQTRLGSESLYGRSWRALTFRIPDNTGVGVVTIDVARTWQPKASDRSADQRYLGVQFQGLRAE